MTLAVVRRIRAASAFALAGASLFGIDTGGRAQEGPVTAAGFTVPAGFEVMRVTTPDLVERPIVADFDEEGRLYVAESSGSNDKVEKQLAEKPHRILRLQDTDGDGIFDSRVIFADRMMLPEGTLWHEGSLYVAAPPSIWKLTDSDGDGVADRREEWFQGKTLTGCANDLHGPYLGPDGWIYWTKGAFAEQTYERPGKAPLVTRAAHIFRRRPEGGVVEAVIAGGMDNPVDVAFTPDGEPLFTATFLEHPQLGRRDALIHAVYGGLYGKPHGVIDAHPRTGDLMPGLAGFGAAAPSGLAHYASAVFGDGYRDNFFVALFNLRKVTRHVLEPSGATFKTRDSDFLVSESLDFHPTDVLEDADGSLLVVDTGAWYKLCCPTSQIAKPDVPGAIYRVKRRGATPVADPRGRTLAWARLSPAALAGLLGDARPAVRQRAVQQLRRLGPGALPALAGVVQNAASAIARREAVWTLARIDGAEARRLVRAALNDREGGVRKAALHTIALTRDADAVPQLLDALVSADASVQRAAAEALGRSGDARAVPALLTLTASPLDRALEHSAIYALIEIDRGPSTLAGLSDASPRVRRAALMALDQMPSGGLAPEIVTPLFQSADAPVVDAAWWVAGHHPEWGGALAGYLGQRLNAARLSDADRALMQQKLAQFAGSAPVQALLAASITEPASPQVAGVALAAMAAARLKELPQGWLEPLASVLRQGDVDRVRLALAVLRASPVPKTGSPSLQQALRAVGESPARPADVRLEALAAVDGGVSPVTRAVFEFLRASLGASQPARIRLAAAGVVERARFDPVQLRAVTSWLGEAGPLELPKLLAAFDRGTDEALGRAMLAALRTSKARAAVRADVLRPRLASYPASVQKEGEDLLLSSSADAKAQARRLDDLLAAARNGDLRRGQMIFNSARAACSTCHAIGYQGGRIGPDLTSIGQIRSERDLLEAIVFPSASFARGYESVVVLTTGGATHSGMLRSERADEVVVATSERDELRIPRQQIEDLQPGTVSLMPPGLADQLSTQELADLLAFLKATRWGAD